MSPFTELVIHVYRVSRQARDRLIRSHFSFGGDFNWSASE